MKFLVVTTKVTFSDENDVVDKTQKAIFALKEIFKDKNVTILDVYTQYLPNEGKHYLKVYIQANHLGGPEITATDLGEIQLKLIEVLCPGGSNEFHIVHS